MLLPPEPELTPEQPTKISFDEMRAAERAERERVYRQCDENRAREEELADLLRARKNPRNSIWYRNDRNPTPVNRAAARDGGMLNRRDITNTDPEP
ncbi:MAG: hypothetical protein LRZ85_03030 [Alphaproteobacteria bacterium]|nr:hypothetical protein [Alphaproteobacteria bacterium]